MQLPGAVMSETPKKQWGERVSAWAVSLVVHGLLLALLAMLVLSAAPEPAIEAVVHLEPVGRPDDPNAQSAGGSAPRVEQTSATSSSPAVAPLPAPALDAATGSTPAPDDSLSKTDPDATDPALALLSELTEALSAQHTGRGDNPLVDGTSEGFQQMLGGIRGRGLDVVFVIDATESMRDIMQQSKERMNDVIGVITGVLASEGKPPRNIRFGVVAFKDYGDEYGLSAAKALKLTNDFPAVRDFIDHIQTGGGGDGPEPIHEALAIAIDKEMGWRPKAASIIVLIGDAPVHPSGLRDAVEAGKRFVSRYSGTLSVIDVGTDRAGVLGDFDAIALAGGGTATLLGSEDEFWEDMVITVFGRRFERDVKTIVERYAKNR